MERDSFVFYRSFAQALARVDTETKAQVLDALCAFALDGKETEVDGVAGALFELMRPQIEANNKRYQNGCKGGRIRTEEEPEQNQTETKAEPKTNQTETKAEPKARQAKTKAEANVNVNVNDNENDNDINSSAAKKAPAAVEAVILSDGSEWRPTQELYEEYCRLFPAVDIQAQFRSMRAWCLSNPKQRKTPAGVSRFVRSWLQREQDSPRQAARKPAQKPTQYDIGALEDALLWR